MYSNSAVRAAARVVHRASCASSTFTVAKKLSATALSQQFARRLMLQVSDAAKEWLALTGYDPVYGARPLRRLVQSAIGDRLARSILAGEVHDGDTVVVDLDEAGDTLTVTRA